MGLNGKHDLKKKIWVFICLQSLGLLILVCIGPQTKTTSLNISEHRVCCELKLNFHHRQTFILVKVSNTSWATGCKCLE